MAVEPIPDPGVEETARWHRTFAPRFFNRTWELMDRPSLTSDEVDEMMASAFAQWAHWHRVGDARNRAIADWQVSRAAVRAGHPDLARPHVDGAPCGDLACRIVHHALAVARAILGRSS